MDGCPEYTRNTLKIFMFSEFSVFSSNLASLLLGFLIFLVIHD